MPPKKQSFISRHGGKAWQAVILAIIGTVTGSIVPVWQQIHSDNLTGKEIDAVEQRQQKALADYEAQQAVRDAAFSLEFSKSWSYLNDDEAAFGNKLHISVRHRWMGITTTNMTK